MIFFPRHLFTAVVVTALSATIVMEFTTLTGVCFLVGCVMSLWCDSIANMMHPKSEDEKESLMLALVISGIALMALSILV